MRPHARPVVCSLVLVLAAWSPDPAEPDTTCNLAASIGTEVTCGLSQECPGEPVQSIACEGDTCTCWTGQALERECPGDGVCGELEAVLQLEQLAEACCGFVFHRG
ncbi:hypothetical protein SAMN02745121_01141 [Nannocystis exedens]|uniref:Uncharacterized protein n=1 Tax=Nannocystis exedens TaxID=54 RepID=A0A1I1UCJ3_9BACT|nr:hypothetical protein [Nannocystis exedens]PCC71597.1 hypothetical protein NAEX_04674 [Nannocystis exedens]SFD68447.1 hypothetical protein SAMN02745121_01141 [Nannocystis exedens]